jgi:hypothetical protein
MGSQGSTIRLREHREATNVDRTYVLSAFIDNSPRVDAVKIIALFS